MTDAYKTSIQIPLLGAPPWLSHIEITRTGDQIVFEVVKESGLTYGETPMSLVDFNNMADSLLKP
jgi:hypothetical protein